MTKPVPSLIDHCIIAVRDFAQAARRFEALGFTLSAPGAHPARGTVNRCIALDNAYLELLSPGGPDCRESFLIDFLTRREGVASIALDGRDIARTHAALAAHLPGIEAPVTGTRDIPGQGAIAFDVQRLAEDTLFPGRWFFCRHRNPEIVYADALRRHRNGAQRLARIAIPADPATIDWLPIHERLGLRLIARETGALRLDADGIRLDFVAGDRARDAVRLELEADGEPAEHALCGIELAVTARR